MASLISPLLAVDCPQTARVLSAEFAGVVDDTRRFTMQNAKGPAGGKITADGTAFLVDIVVTKKIKPLQTRIRTFPQSHVEPPMDLGSSWNFHVFTGHAWSIWALMGGTHNGTFHRWPHDSYLCRFLVAILMRSSPENS